MKLLSNDETANLLGLKPATLENWRWRGVGPKFVRVGGRVKYSERDVLSWVDAHTSQSTSERASATTAQK